MRIIGIVAEYNPFHLGHLHQLNSTKEYFGEDTPVIAVMSGDFVQRGDIAVYSKFARAEAACRCGVDLVVELPLPWALSSAESFARGAVSVLDALGVNVLSFGSEAGELSALENLAAVLSEEEIYEDIKSIQIREPSLSFAAARELALENKIGSDAKLLEQPNNILAVEYIKAMKYLGTEMKPFTVKRIGSAHDGLGTEGPRSASEIREHIYKGESILDFVHARAADIYTRERAEGKELSDRERFEVAVLSRLRMLPQQAFSEIPDTDGGLAERMYKAVKAAASLEELYALTKTKRYAHARIRRAFMSAALGVKKQMNYAMPPYARLLAANLKGCELIRKITAESKIPVLTKPAHVNKLAPYCTDIFSVGADAHDMFLLSCRIEKPAKTGEDWRRGPVIVKNL